MYRLRGDRDQMINHIISECGKLAQKEYKNRHDCEGKMIHKNCARNLTSLTSGIYTTWNSFYRMRYPKFFGISMYVPADHKVNLKEREKKDNYLDLAMEHESDGDTNCNWFTCLWCNSYRRKKWTRQHEFKSWTRQIAFHIALIPLGKVWIQ